MLKLFGNFEAKGGFEVTSKHDILTAVITCVLIVAAVVLQVTHTLTGQLVTIFGGLLTAIGTYWFVRGGMVSQQGNAPATSDIANAVVQGLTNAAQTPAHENTTSSGSQN